MKHLVRTRKLEIPGRVKWRGEEENPIFGFGV